MSEVADIMNYQKAELHELVEESDYSASFEKLS